MGVACPSNSNKTVQKQSQWCAQSLNYFLNIGFCCYLVQDKMLCWKKKKNSLMTIVYAPCCYLCAFLTNPFKTCNFWSKDILMKEFLSDH